MVEDVAWDPHLVLATSTTTSEGEAEDVGLHKVQILAPEEPVHLVRPASNRSRNLEAVVAPKIEDLAGSAEVVGYVSTVKIPGAEWSSEKNPGHHHHQKFTPYLPEIKVMGASLITGIDESWNAQWGWQSLKMALMCYGIKIEHIVASFLFGFLPSGGMGRGGGGVVAPRRINTVYILLYNNYFFS